MKKVMVFLLIVSFVLLLIPFDSNAGDRGHGRGYYRGYGHGYHGGGHHGSGHHGGHHDSDFWLGLGIGIVGGAFVDTPYRPYHYDPYRSPRSVVCYDRILVDYRICDRSGCWTEPRWITVRVPCW